MDHLKTTLTFLTLFCAVLAGALADSAARWRTPGREREDAGYVTETVVVTALLAAAAIAVLAVLTARLMAKVNSINL